MSNQQPTLAEIKSAIRSIVKTEFDKKFKQYMGFDCKYMSLKEYFEKRIGLPGLDDTVMNLVYNKVEELTQPCREANDMIDHFMEEKWGIKGKKNIKKYRLDVLRRKNQKSDSASA